MHLEITQSTGQTESIFNNIGGQVVNALYNLAISGDLDNTSTVSGRISIYAANKFKVEYLAGTNGVGGNGIFPDLYITCSTYYVDFMDEEFGKVCGQLYGDGTGVTVSQLSAVSNLNTLRATQNSNVTKLDLRQFPALVYQTGYWNFPNVTEIYIKAVGFSTSVGGTIQISSFKNMGTVVSDRRYIDKLIIKTVQTKSSGTQKFLGGTTESADQKTDFGTIAIKNFYAPNGGDFKIGEYLTRGNRHITNLYLGGNAVIACSTGYGDNIFNIENIYVPIGMKSQYEANSTWSRDGTVHPFYEYDFENDPDNIFAAFS